MPKFIFLNSEFYVLNLLIVVSSEVIYGAFLKKDKLLDSNLISLAFKICICQEARLPALVLLAVPILQTSALV